MKDIIDSLKIRLNNPFLVAFAISWPLWNWKIVVVLFRYNAETLPKYTGAKNFIEYIINNYNNCLGLFAPALSAVAFIALSPMVKYVITYYNTCFSAKENAEVLKITKKYPVSGTVYLEALEESSKNIDRIAEIMTQKAEFVEENNRLSSENSILKTERDGFQSEVKIFKENVDILNKELVSAHDKSKEWSNKYLEETSKHLNKQMQLDTLKVDCKILEEKLNEANSKLNEFFRSTDEFINGYWGGSFYVPENSSSFSTAFKIHDGNISELTTGTGMALDLKGLIYYNNQSGHKPLFIFRFEINREKFDGLPDDKKELNEKLLREINEVNFTGQIFDEGNNLDLYNKYGIRFNLFRIPDSN